MANPTNTNFPLSFFFILTALSSADSSRIILNQVAPQPLDQLKSDLSFFMHDILGGSHPTARTVTGTTPNKAQPTAGLPFSKPKKSIFPLPGGVPLINTNRNSNGGGTNNNNNNNQPFVTAGQLPSGAALQHVMFGSLTTIDDELTEGEELGSAVMGRGQGFYFVSSLDGSSHTVALTVILHQYDEEDKEKKDEDTISFFGVHRRGSPESPIAVVGGTGKYENAGGFAVIENLPRRDNQYMTDGDDMIVHFRVYLSE
ncbi:dirigent protein 9-like [Benincasa hispida]|uniref:dirigent protein 9-like n=1 Tax=Benincasa hispida TaxID=102211 RepID=UPI0018FF50F0|nr:dirigent protein 9-like [Benincasa hispida]